MTAIFFGAEKAIYETEYWRFILRCTLVTTGGAFLEAAVSQYDAHLPVYHHPIAVARLFIVQVAAGLGLGAGAWILIKWSVRRMAKFHHPARETWRGLTFRGPKKRWMTADERVACLRKMNLADYGEFLQMNLVIFASFPFIILWLDLVINAPLRGFGPVIKPYFRNLIGAEITLLVIGFAFSTIIWLLQRLVLWLGWNRTLV